MDVPPVQFTRTSDGYNVAYTVSGEGRPFVFMSGTFGNVHVAWKRYRRWFEGLSRRFRVVAFDPRGWGYSTRDLPEDLAWPDFERDLPAVMDAVGFSRAVLYANGGDGMFAVRLAHAHPERVEAIIWSAAHAAARDFPRAIFDQLPRENWDMFLRTLAPRGLQGEEFDGWLSETRECVTYDDYTRVIAPVFLDPDLSVEDELRSLPVPLLVTVPRHFPPSMQEKSREAATLAPNGRFVLVDADLANPLGTLHGNPDQGLVAIDDFLGNSPAASPPTATTAANLSVREAEVLRFIAAGKTNEEIADELVISRNTVRRHVSNIFDKTGVTNRSQAGAYARDHGLV